MMIGPGAIIADYIRNPSLIGCKTRYFITQMGHALTGLPVGHAMDGRSKTMELMIRRPQGTIVRPIYKDVRKIVSVPVTLGQRLEIECEGMAPYVTDEVFWLTKPCRGVTECTSTFVSGEGRVREQLMNTTLLDNVIGYPVSTKLIIQRVQESDLASTFYCKLESSGADDIVIVYLQDRNAYLRRSPAATRRGK